ncbi:MAG: Fic family protein [Hyphomicrobiales bacterium]|nr:Fic family protein [Hyphomicrobiales bacterium]
MDVDAFKAPAGKLVDTIAGQKAFVPDPLPPDLDLSPIQQLLSDADQKLGELRGIGRYLPNPYLLIRPLQRKEAIASSNIEGTYTSLPELLLFESSPKDEPATTDTREVFNYTRALQIGITRLEDIPISNRLIRELHQDLLAKLPSHRSGHHVPGEYRREQNFIGRSKDISKSRFNPPPPPLHLECMNALELFINKDDMANITPLVFIAMIHYQFETIHPFPDGNGRVGRILIPLILHSRKILDQPLLYMSQYFEDNRDEYVDIMLSVSQQSFWMNWIRFFLKGVLHSCEKTIETIHRVRELQDAYYRKCHTARSSALLLKIIDHVFERIVVTVPRIRELTQTSYTAAQNNVNKLVEYGILSESTSSRRPKYYFATELLDIFGA